MTASSHSHPVLPPTIEHEGANHDLERVLKSGRFSNVGLYALRPESGRPEPDPSEPVETDSLRCVLKLYTSGPILGPVGRLLARRECRNLERLAGIAGVPRAIGAPGPGAVLYAWLPGESLVKGRALPADFFPRLEDLLRTVHERGVAHRDLSKRDNVLVGEDGAPLLIDFQISMSSAPAPGLLGGLHRRVLARFQRADRFHLWKHWRRCQPDTLPEAVRAALEHPGPWIRLHRIVAWPYRSLRARRRRRS